MKIKQDFVTNSSSTSFILHTRCVGFLPVNYYFSIAKDLSYLEGKKELETLIGNVFAGSSYTINHGTYSSNYSHLKISNPEYTEDNSYEEDLEIDLMLVLVASDEDEWDENTNEVHCIKTILKIETHPTTIRHKNPIHEEIVNLLKLITKKVEIPFCQLIYTCIPEDTGSDGWNGGDPWGKYATSPELAIHETKVGNIFIVNNKIVTEITGPKDSFKMMSQLESMFNKGEPMEKING